MPLRERLKDSKTRTAIAADAVAQAEAAVEERSGLRGAGAQVGLDTINRLRPNFLHRHVHAQLPAWAEAIEPYWDEALPLAERRANLIDNGAEVTAAMLAVSDAYVDRASDPKAIAVYRRLRPFAPKRITAQMPRIADFVERHTS